MTLNSPYHPEADPAPAADALDTAVVVSWKAPIVYGVITVLSAVLFVVARQDGDDFADRCCGRGAGFHRGFHRCDIAAHERAHEARTDFFPADRFDVGADVVGEVEVVVVPRQYQLASAFTDAKVARGAKRRRTDRQVHDTDFRVLEHELLLRQRVQDHQLLRAGVVLRQETMQSLFKALDAPVCEALAGDLGQAHLNTPTGLSNNGFVPGTVMTGTGGGGGGLGAEPQPMRKAAEIRARKVFMCRRVGTKSEDAAERPQRQGQRAR